LGASGGLQSAIKSLSTAIELDPRFFQAYYNRGIAYNKIGELNKAVLDIEKAARLQKKSK
ncbi:MAG: tetratricopeptide repeat protein, partial [Desulfobulbia bacterium]